MIFDPHGVQPEEEGARHPFTVPIPFLRGPIGSGDLVKRLTDALHVPQCGGCRGRQEEMNRAVEFRPLSFWED